MRILIVRTSAMGDVIHCLPVLRALRRHHPEAHIGWVVEGAMAPLLEGHPDLDEVLTVSLRAWRKRPWTAAKARAVWGFVERLSSFAPDVVLDLMGNHKAGILSALTFSDQRFGLARRARREPSSALWINREAEPKGRHAVDRALAVASTLLPADVEVDFGGEHLFPGAPAPSTDEDERVVIQAGAGWANKTYPPERWGRVASLLAERRGVRSVVPIAPGEEHLARGVEASSEGAARALDAPSLASLAGLQREARLVLGGDTGPIHLAHALGIPTLALMGPTDPEMSGPYGAPESSLAVRLPCSFCQKRYADPAACLLRISPEDVATRASELLRSPPGSHGPDPIDQPR